MCIVFEYSSATSHCKLFRDQIMVGNSFHPTYNCYIRKSAKRPLNNHWQQYISINEDPTVGPVGSISIVQSGIQATDLQPGKFFVSATTASGVVVYKSFSLVESAKYDIIAFDKVCKHHHIVAFQAQGVAECANAVKASIIEEC